ncbi:dehydrodolichyl diphosphate synthase complex subunit DHDDS-like [Pecten maximus]|uniref:dehydrodolichyl diphosphate synthase complex subunit DHDDS-like n=1 Tax=Pecten maximus TaxID=6579 RepID=UPI0014583479|nr:dehydrodolichyl diphosphate synthase complex subunit DHDDS-like [Pecten maximus]
MSWFPEKKTSKSCIHQICTKVLKTGPVPKHVAIIMDGNRRFAKKNSMERAEGHLKGFDKLAETLEWCLDLGITEVTVYAFSIENFKRSKEEVGCLMEIARQKFARLMQERELIQKHEVCVRVLGNLSLLPPDIQQVVADAVEFSKDNTRAILNVCFSYTSRDEICAGMRELAEGVSNGLIRTSDISEELLDNCLYTRKSRDPDLLIRTSGEVRLSDFLLWQTAYSCLAFVSVLWPEFSVWHLYSGILHYQKNYQALQDAKEKNDSEKERRQRESDYENVLKDIKQQNSLDKSEDVVSIQCRVQQYAKDREARINKFLQHLDYKQEQFFQSMLHQKSTFTAN